MDQKNYSKDIAAIRSMMEKSSKFISLSGVSGILAGVYSLAGAFVAYRIIYFSPFILYDSTRGSSFSTGVIYLIIDAFLVILLTVVTGVVLTRKKAAKNSQPVWNGLSRRLLINLLIPLVTGGIVIVMLSLKGFFSLLALFFLIFYGLALVNCSHLTLRDVRYLGISEIVLGIISLLIPGYGLLFWAIGFGILHIIYGTFMYFKYDK